ncbi:MAG: lipid-A-disaccharide synthase N-terminal domain-containing protein [Hyphomicrobiaceae bacterium]
MSPLDRVWLGIGMFGQLMFTGRWFVQWIATERARRSIVPAAFWYFSFIGGLLVLAYGVYRADPVIILGQFGVFIYARNIYFLLRTRAEPTGDPAAAPPKIAAQ